MGRVTHCSALPCPEARPCCPASGGSRVLLLERMWFSLRRNSKAWGPPASCRGAVLELRPSRSLPFNHWNCGAQGGSGPQRWGTGRDPDRAAIQRLGPQNFWLLGRDHRGCREGLSQGRTVWVPDTAAGPWCAPERPESGFLESRQQSGVLSPR